MNRTLTSESVSEGHPDKICDQISDEVLDACLKQDPATTRAGIETFAKSNLIVVGGELTTTADIDIPSCVDAVINRIGYADDDVFMRSFMCMPGGLHKMVCINKQSDDIAQGVDRAKTEDQGAGDQGMMFGYATNETEAGMPAPVFLAHRLTMATTRARREGRVSDLGPDSKAMVTMAYEGGKPVCATTVLLSVQHHEGVKIEDLRRELWDEVVLPSIPEQYVDDRVRFLLNPTGAFILGGPRADAGLTGRKIIVDTYGGASRHGGGAFSGKDPSKVDRSAAYAARWVAKTVVDAGAAERCEVQVSYAIGQASPVAVDIETFGTATVDPAMITKTVEEMFDLRPASIIRDLQLLRPVYAKTATYGHFGRPEFTWEQTTRAGALRGALGL